MTIYVWNIAKIKTDDQQLIATIKESIINDNLLRTLKPEGDIGSTSNAVNVSVIDIDGGVKLNFDTTTFSALNVFQFLHENGIDVESYWWNSFRGCGGKYANGIIESDTYDRYSDVPIELITEFDMDPWD